MSAGLYVCFEIVKNMVTVAMIIHVLGIKIKLLNLMPFKTLAICHDFTYFR